jgi:DNA-binding XRE family transcriptional regulator
MPRRRTLPELIRRAGHTHRSLGAKVGLHWTYFSKMSRGQRVPPLDVAWRLARELRVSLDELFKSIPKTRSA